MLRLATSASRQPIISLNAAAGGHCGHRTANHEERPMPTNFGSMELIEVQRCLESRILFFTVSDGEGDHKVEVERVADGYKLSIDGDAVEGPNDKYWTAEQIKEEFGLAVNRKRCEGLIGRARTIRHGVLIR